MAGLISLFIGITFVFMVSEYDIFAESTTSEQKMARKKRGTSSSRHRKGKGEPVKDIGQEPPIENMEAFVNEYDLVAKQKMVNDLLDRGVTFCKSHDLKTICHAFTHTKDFVHGALYLFLIDTNGVVYAHGNETDLVWKNILNNRDMFGVPIIQSMISLAHSGGGLLTYEWDGAIKVAQIKSVSIGGKDFVIGCGYYPHSKEYAVIGLVKGAVALFNKHVQEDWPVTEAFSDMSYPGKSQFIFGDLYLYALDFDGIIVAQGERPGLIGSPALDYADAKGKKYNTEIIGALKNKEAGEGIWIDYVSKRALKHAYAEKVTDDKGKNYFIACGYYPEINRDTTIDLVRQGYQHMKSVGLSKAMHEFDEEQGEEYRYGDLGLVVYDMEGNCLAHGRKKDYVGQNQYSWKDEDGRYFVREMIAQAKAGGGWVSFKLNNSFQSMYVEHVDLGVGEYVIGCGMYPVSKPETMRLLVKSAVGYLTDHSIADLLERLVNRSDQFLRGDLFLYVLDASGFCYGWGDSYQFIWKNLMSWKDENGKPFIQLMVESAQHGPDHVVATLNKCQRVHYFEMIEKGEKKYILGSGFYK